MKKGVVVLMVIAATHSFAQNRNSVWCFGDSAGINFSNINNPVPFTSSVEGRGSCVSIADNNGNLLFYSNTWMYIARTIVWNALHDTMTNSYPMGGGGYIMSCR